MRFATLKAKAMACPTTGMLYGTKGALLPLTLLHLVALKSSDVMMYVAANGSKSSMMNKHTRAGVLKLLMENKR